MISESPRIIHANAVCMYGIGILISGSPGSGKTTLCHNLLKKKHQLIADDAVLLKRQCNQWIADAPDATKNKIVCNRHSIESVTDLYGPYACYAKECPLMIHVQLNPCLSPYTHSPSYPVLPIQFAFHSTNASAFEFRVQNTINYQ